MFRNRQAVEHFFPHSLFLSLALFSPFPADVVIIIIIIIVMIPGWRASIDTLPRSEKELCVDEKKNNVHTQSFPPRLSPCHTYHILHFSSRIDFGNEIENFFFSLPEKLSEIKLGLSSLKLAE